MAKTLKDSELLSLLYVAMFDSCLIRDRDRYLLFLDDLAEVVGKHLGAKAGTSGYTEDNDLGYTVAFHITDETPPDGGVFSLYDKYVTWENGKEYEAGNAPSAMRERLAVLKDQLARPEKYPELFEGEFREWLDEGSEVCILSKYYDVLDVLKRTDPGRYKGFMEGFILDTLPQRPSTVLESIKEEIEDIEKGLKK